MKDSEHEIEIEWPGKIRLVARGWPALIACTAIVASIFAATAHHFW